MDADQIRPPSPPSSLKILCHYLLEQELSELRTEIKKLQNHQEFSSMSSNQNDTYEIPEAFYWIF